VLITFISEGNEFNSSTVHRCLMISKEIKKKGYQSNVLYGSSIFDKIPNLIYNWENWKLINKEKPQVIILHRSSNLIDYHMVKKTTSNSKVIYDLDDALFHTRFPGKINYYYMNKIMRLSNAVGVGSHYLKNYSKKFNKNIFLIPTPVDTNIFTRKKLRESNIITIGWLGGGTGLQLEYLKIIKKPLNFLSRKYDIKFKMVSALSKSVRDEFSNVNFEVDFGLDHWVPIEKIPELISDFDIGIMPLGNMPFERGKCAMKALEYMAMGIPVVASPVGENNFVIKNEYNGFLASNDSEWTENLEKLILNKTLRKKLGDNAYDFVKENYSLEIVAKKFIEMIEDIT